MAGRYGMQIFNSGGGYLLTEESRLAKFYGTYSGTVGRSATTNVTVPGISNNGEWAISYYGTTALASLTIYEGYVSLTGASVLASSTSFTFVVFKY